MTRASLTILALLAGGALVGGEAPRVADAAPAAAEAQAGPVTVMSFNIRYGTARDGENSWEHRRDAVIDLIDASDAQVLGLQEALAFQLGEITAALPRYERIGVGRSDGVEAGEFAAILIDSSRLELLAQDTFWFSDTPEAPGSTSWGNDIPRIGTWARLRDRASGSTFYVYNVHWDHRSQPSRQRSADLLLEIIAARAAANDPVLVTGDFNAGEDNPAFRRLLQASEIELIDTFRALHPHATGVGTFNGFTGDVDGDKIDAVLASTQWQVVAADIVRSNRSGRYPSDHFPVTARLALHQTPQTPGDDTWTRFRGPNGSGVADGAALPTEIGPDRNVVWKVAIPEGYSSPVIGDGRIFLTAVEDDRLWTIALDQADGTELWRREAPRPRVERLDPRNNPAAPSPAVDGERVYVFFAEFGLLAYDFDGEELWRMPLGPFDNLYGMGASPIVFDGKVLLVCDQRTGSFLIAVDGESGEVVWRVEREEAASSHATPIVWQPVDGEPQLLVVGSFLFSGYSIETGERLWWVRGMIHEMKSVPVIADGVAYVNGYGSPLNDPGNTIDAGSFEEALAYDADGDGLLSREELPEGRARQRVGMSDLDRDGKLSERDWNYFRNSMAMTNGMFAIRLGGTGDMTAESFLWRYSRAVPQLPSPLLYGGYLYMINDGGIVTILDPDSGDRLEQNRLVEAVDSYYASPVAGDGKIYFVSELGKLSVVEPGPTLEVIASADLDDTVYATPAIDGGRIYLRTGSTLYCFGLAP